MANKKTTYVLEIDAEVNQLKSKLETTKTALDKLGDSSFSVGMGKKIASILTQLEKLQKKASQPIDSKATFSSLEKGFGSIVVDAKNLLGELEKISNMVTREKLSLLPEGEAKKLKDALGAVQAYTKAVEKAEKARIRSQERRKGEREVVNTQLGEAKESQKKAKTTYTEATAKGTKYGDARAIVAQAEAAKKAQKEIDQLEKQLKKYQKRLEELNDIENRTAEQEAELQTTRSNVKSIGGKIGARKKITKRDPDEKTLTAANKTIEEQAPAIEALEESVAQAEKEITRLENALVKLDEAIKNNSTEITSSQADYKILYEQAKKLGVSLEGVTEDVNPTNVRILTERMRDLVNEGVKPLDDAIEEVTPDIRELGDVATQTGEKISNAEEHFGSMVDNQSRINNLKENIRQFIGWAGASKVLGAAMRNAFQDIKELDKAMTEIAVVTDFDISDMWDQMPQYTERANELGLAITEVYEASALFYQQGLDTNEMMALSNETLKMAKIAGLDAAEATDRMTAALRGFNMELDEVSAKKVADVYSELAAITASDVDEISSAMTKTASIASSAGMEFETTAAFLSQIIETTRESAETAGTAMKTVIARFQELKKSPDEIGEIDGEIVDANAIEGALRSVGVSLRDASGQFRELDDVFLELSSKWDGLDKNTQRYIATIAAGSRQQSRFIAMMQDYERTQELVTAANNSAGASQKQYEKTMESIDTKLKQLDNAWTEFSTGLMNSDLVKFAVDFLTNLLNALNRVSEGFGGLTSSLSKIGTMVAIFQTVKTVVNKFFDEIIAKVYTSAVSAGEKLAQGTQDGINNKGGTTGVVGRVSGYSQMMEGVSLIQKSKQVRIGDSAQVQAYQNQKNANIEKRNGIESRYEKAVIDAGPDVAKIREAEIKRLEELAENEKELTEIEKNRYYTQEEANEMSKQGFKNIAQGAQAAAQAITMVGAGLGMVGQMFKEAGLEEVGEKFQSAGNIITFVGSALMALVPIISLLGTTFTIAGKKITLAGLMAQAGWWPLLLIGLAIAAVVTTIVLVADAIKKASPEYKLEQAQKAADKAADAADRAAESYENLVNTFEELETGYDTLKDLTRGTKEWNEAVKNINNSVLDLIAEYPELAKFVDNEGGVLTINIDDAGVQQVLKDAETSAAVAKNSSTLANLSVAKAEDDLAYKNLDDDAKFNLGGAKAAYGGAMAGSILAGAGTGAGAGALLGLAGGPFAALTSTAGAIGGAIIGGIGGLIGGFFAGEAAKDAALEDTQNTTESLAKAIADGAIIDNGSGYDVKDAEKLAKYGLKAEDLSDYYAQVGDSTEALRDFGEQLLQTSAQEEAAFGAVAASAYQLANTLGMTEEEQVQASNIVDDASIKKMYEDNMSDLEGIDFTVEEGSNAITDDQRKMRDDAIRAQYGADARIEGNKVTFRDAEGKQQTEELTNDELKAMIANNITTQEAKTAVEMAPAAIDHVISKMGFSEDSKEAKAIEAAAMDREGGNLTAEEVQTLKGLDDEKLKQIYNDMSEEQKNVFGSQTEYLKKIKGAGEIADGAFENARKSIEKTGAEIKSFMTADMAKGFAGKMEEVWETTGEEGVKQIQDAYNTLLDGQDDETKQKITTRMNALDWSNTEQLLAFEIELEEQYGYSREEAQKMTKAMSEGAKATSNLTTTVEVFGDFYHATEKLNAALEKTSDLQWKYERMLKNGAKATELATNLEEQRQSILESGFQALAAYEAARADQVTTYAKGVNLAGVGKDVTQYVKLDENTGIYDLTELQRQINAGEFGAEGTESRKAVENYISELKEANELAEDQLDAAKEAYEQLEDLNEQAEEAYWSLYETIENAIVENLESQIELQENLLDVTEAANEKIISKLQEQIDSDRRVRENEKQEEEIKDLQARAAYLGMDTSDVNVLELLDLEKQIAEQEQDYQEKLVDQSLQLLQDANEKAADQRKEQIDLAREQLEIYKNSPEFQANVENTLSEFLTQLEQGIDVRETTLGGMLTGQDFYKQMHPGEETDFWYSLAEEGALAKLFQKIGTYAGGDKTDGTQADLLDGIMKNTEGFAHLQLQEAVSTANVRASQLSDTLGFTLANTATKDKTGYTISDQTSSYVSGVSSISQRFAKGTDEAQTLETNRDAAKVKRDKLDKYGLWRSSYDESNYYNNLQKDKTKSEQLRNDLATTGDSELLWHNWVDDYYNAMVLSENEELSSKVDQLVEKHRRDGYETILDNAANNGLADLRLRYQELNSKTEDEARTHILNMVKTSLSDWSYGSIDADGDDGWHVVNTRTGTWDYSQYKLDGVNYANLTWNAQGIVDNLENNFLSDEAEPDWIALSDNNLYRYFPGNSKIPGGWAPLVKDSHGNKLLEAYKQKLRSGGSKYRTPAFETGGLADFTGPAWLDGTPSHPEYILNARQTERFFSLIDVLEGYDTEKNKKPSSGDNYFDIEINVEKIEDDYDVEQMADKIRRMIYDDAAYRNVNSINHIR